MAERKTKVLLVEDDYPAGAAMMHLFKRHGCEVMHVARGDEALALARTMTPDVIALDIKLPGGIDGYRVLENLKNDPSLKDVPVVIVTNYGLMQDIEKGRSLGADAYLVKSDHSIHAIVERVLKHAKKAGGGRVGGIRADSAYHIHRLSCLRESK